MGIADIIPGVSGGTIAIITGVYEELLKTINGLDSKILKNLLVEIFFVEKEASFIKLTPIKTTNIAP